MKNQKKSRPPYQAGKKKEKDVPEVCVSEEEFVQDCLPKDLKFKHEIFS